jgi:hypothetical protein
MQDFVKRLHAAGQHWVPIQDAGVALAENYSAYEEGVKDNIWIKDYKDRIYVGQVPAIKLCCAALHVRHEPA